MSVQNTPCGAPGSMKRLGGWGTCGPGRGIGGGVEGGWALSYVFSKISEFPKIAPNKSFGNS